jgi:transposase
VRYWLNAHPTDPTEFRAQVRTVCQLYEQAPDLLAQGIHVISSDEMTGIQALERAAPTTPVERGQPERQEFEYIRHGTQSLIADWQVATGTVLSASIGATRTEADFATHIAQTIATDAQAGWVFIVDQLNTHQSETLVRLVNRCCTLNLDLGENGSSGILQSMPTRAAFLSDSTHRIRFVYVPKHSSWLNQIECWFSILVRRLLKRGNFTSTEDLRQQILNFIAYFNRFFAKPFNWKFKGFSEPV